MDHNTKVEVGTTDGTLYIGTIIKDEKESPEYLLLSDVWVDRFERNPAQKSYAFIRTSNITYITNV